MTLDDSAIDRLAQAIAALTGETLTEAVRTALAERLERERMRRGAKSDLAERMLEAAKEYAALPTLDDRTADEIIGYDETGMWR